MTRLHGILRTTARAVVLGAAMAAAGAPALDAQVMASEEATFSQTIDGTVISMRYARPSRRGRAVLFGEQMPWGERWTPGANTATTLRTDHDITLDGHEVPAGSYSVWMDLRESGPWQVVLDPDTTLFHMAHPPDSDTQLRFEVTPTTGPELETLLWSVDSVRATGGVLRMHWGTTVVSMPLKVPSSRRLTATPEEAAAVVGSWSGAAQADSTTGMEAGSLTFDVTYASPSGVLSGSIRFLDGPMATQPAWEILLLPVADGVFTAGWGEDGELWETIPWFLEFARGDDGSFTSLEVRDQDSDAIVMTVGRSAPGTS